MRIRFSCVAFVPPDSQLGVTGDPAFLGKWNPSACVPLIPHHAPSKCGTEPSLWYADVEVDEQVLAELGAVSSGAAAEGKAECIAFQKDLLACVERRNAKRGGGSRSESNALRHADRDEEMRFLLAAAAYTVEPWAKDVQSVLERHPLRQVSFDFKFILWSATKPATPYVPVVPGETGTCDIDGRLATSWRTWLFPATPAHVPQPPAANSVVIWEGDGPRSNRKFTFDAYDVLVDQSEKGEPEVLYLCKIAQFQDPRVMDSSECSHTSRFYSLVKNQGRMHYSRILPTLIVGSCPRQLSHIDHMKRDLGVTAVFNLQTMDDIRANFPDPNAEDRSPEAVSQLYDSRGILYTWTPTEDMSNSSRKLAAAQCALLLSALLQNGHTVYVHCNAGVGRSVAAVSAYLCFCLNLDIRKTNFFMISRRPVAYWDEEAMKYGRSDYRAKFAGGAAQA